MLAVPIYSLQIYDRVLTSRSGATLVYLTIIACLLIAGYSILESIRLKILLRLGNRFELSHAKHLIQACITESARLSRPSSTLLRDLAVVRSFISSPQGIVTLIDVPISLLFMLTVFLINSALGGAMLFGAVLMLLIAILTEKATLELIRSANQASQEAQFTSAEIIERSELIEALGMREHLIKHWQHSAQKSLHYQSKSSDWIATNTAISRWSRLIVSIAMTALGAYLAIESRVTIGAMIASSMLMGRGLAPLENVISLWRQLTNVRLSWSRVQDALNAPNRPENTLKLPRPTGLTRLEEVTYTPPGMEHPIIKKLSLELPAGTMLGIVGPVAAGKSTLAKLICGVWKPQSGTVRLDGADVYTWERSDFGRHIGYLPQDAELLSGSIRDNIARFSESSDASIIEAAQLANVHEIILRLPRGYDTHIGPGGIILSGGTRQRIGLARAIFGNPSLLVLDEPSASLDTSGENALINVLKTMRNRGTSIVVISHQPTILHDADLIAVLVDGQINKFGPRRELLPRREDTQEVRHEEKRA